jgi:prefoldin subunit 5
MKTISYFIIVFAAILFGANVNAQSSLQQTLQELQAQEASLNNDIAAAQADMVPIQDQIALLDAQIADGIANGDDVTALEQQRQPYLDALAQLQQSIDDMQQQLQALQNDMLALQDQINQQDKNWILANMPPPVPTPAQTPNNITNVTHPNLPNTPLMFFVPTGNTTLDEQLVHDWLFQRGLVDQ